MKHNFEIRQTYRNGTVFWTVVVSSDAKMLAMYYIREVDGEIMVRRGVTLIKTRATTVREAFNEIIDEWEA